MARVRGRLALSESCGWKWPRGGPSGRTDSGEGGRTVEDVHVYVNRPAEKEDAALEDLGEALRALDYVSDVDLNPPGNVVAVSYEGGKEEREAIKRTVEEAGYEDRQRVV